MRRARLQQLSLTHFSALDGDTGAARARYPDGWQVDDLAYDYAAPPNLLSIDENALHIARASRRASVRRRRSRSIRRPAP